MNDKMRAYHFDLKRGLWSEAYMAQVIEHLQRWRYNTVVLEIEDKMQWASTPGVAAPDALSPAQIGALADRCREHGIEVIPLVQTLGHAESVVGLDRYAHLRESPEVKDQYDPMSPQVRDIIMGLLDEAINAVRPREYLHVGGDETWSLGCGPQSQAVVSREGVGGLYLRHMRPIWDHLRRRGLRPMMWADIFLSHPHIIKEVPEDVVLVDWDYWTNADRPKKIMIWGGFQPGDRNKMIDMQGYPKALARESFRTCLHPYAVDAASEQDGCFQGFYGTHALKGHGVAQVIVASANSCGGDAMGLPRSELHLANCWHGAKQGMAVGQGTLVTSWAVRHVHQEVKQLGMFAASFSETQSLYDLDEICAAYTQDLYGRSMPELARIVRLTSDRFSAGQAHTLATSRRSLPQGTDEIDKFLEQEADEHGGPEAMWNAMRDIRESHAQARELIQQMQRQAKLQAGNLAFWLEGVDVNLFYLDYVLARQEGSLNTRQDEFRERLAGLQQRTRTLFAPTLTARGLEIELEARYGYHAAALGTGRAHFDCNSGIR